MHLIIQEEIYRYFQSSWKLFRIKVAHHTWIKFLKSRQNSLMMKNEETYMTDTNVQKANEKSFFGKIMTFKKLVQ